VLLMMLLLLLLLLLLLGNVQSGERTAYSRQTAPHF
jgi:hypothetical protein